jgi:hypothetical protein
VRGVVFGPQDSQKSFGRNKPAIFVAIYLNATPIPSELRHVT